MMRLPVTGNGIYEKLAGKLKLASSGGNLTTAARQDFGAFAALYSLSPFVFSIEDTALMEAVGAAWKEIYTDWLQYKEALDDASKPHSSNLGSQWFDDRAAFLERKSWFNANNIDPSNPGAANTKYQGERILWTDAASDYTITAGVIDANSRRYYFGDLADSVRGPASGRAEPPVGGRWRRGDLHRARRVCRGLGCAGPTVDTSGLCCSGD